MFGHILTHHQTFVRSADDGTLDGVRRSAFTDEVFEVGDVAGFGLHGDRFRHGELVTFRRRDGRLLWPHWAAGTLGVGDPRAGESPVFRVWKVSGSSGDRIGHGDRFALSTPYKVPVAWFVKRNKWLTADPAGRLEVKFTSSEFSFGHGPWETFTWFYVPRVAQVRQVPSNTALHVPSYRYRHPSAGPVERPGAQFKFEVELTRPAVLGGAVVDIGGTEHSSVEVHPSSLNYPVGQKTRTFTLTIVKPLDRCRDSASYRFGRIVRTMTFWSRAFDGWDHGSFHYDISIATVSRDFNVTSEPVFSTGDPEDQLRLPAGVISTLTVNLLDVASLIPNAAYRIRVAERHTSFLHIPDPVREVTASAPTATFQLTHAQHGEAHDTCLDITATETLGRDVRMESRSLRLY
jgi:hypothetical protein